MWKEVIRLTTAFLVLLVNYVKQQLMMELIFQIAQLVLIVSKEIKITAPKECTVSKELNSLHLARLEPLEPQRIYSLPTIALIVPLANFVRFTAKQPWKETAPQVIIARKVVAQEPKMSARLEPFR